MFLPRKILEKKLLEMLSEDLGQGDITTELVVPSGTWAIGEVIAKEEGVAAGIEEATILLECLGLKVKALANDGEKIQPKQTLLKIHGDAKTLLSVERTLLNLLSRMSGIATATRKLAETISKAKLKTRIACTRKTAPGLLYFDKKAVLIGGGDTHRLHLDDMVLIKDNHLAICGNIEETIKKVRKNVSCSKKIEVEVTNPNDAVAAAKSGADIIMLDNFSPEEIEKTCKLLKKAKLFGKALIEASGGITAENILKFASTGVDLISLGEITHSSKALDISLEIKKAPKKARDLNRL
ncbi:MAG: carboxylating nicotinate-nucleotide diphosphorylase [Candidatus Bathyarchaeia archaeon]